MFLEFLDFPQCITAEEVCITLHNCWPLQEKGADVLLHTPKDGGIYSRSIKAFTSHWEQRPLTNHYNLRGEGHSTASESGQYPRKLVCGDKAKLLILKTLCSHKVKYIMIMSWPLFILVLSVNCMISIVNSWLQFNHTFFSILNVPERIFLKFLTLLLSWEWTNMFALCQCMFIIIVAIQNNYKYCDIFWSSTVLCYV